jgi:hypothetical protein
MGSLIELLKEVGALDCASGIWDAAEGTKRLERNRSRDYIEASCKLTPFSLIPQLRRCRLSWGVWG